MNNTIQKVTVIGAGTMGNGIAHVFAMSGFEVTLVDISKDALERALDIIAKNLTRMVKKEKITAEDQEKTLNSIKTETSLSDAVQSADLVVEAATENVDLKLKIFKDIDANAPGNAILATNTSSISITKIAAATKRPGQVIGMHFFNPVPVMKLVEVIRGLETTDTVTQSIMQLAEKVGKVPVEVNDFPGFISNRVLMPMINEAIYSLYEGVAGVAEIDTVMQLGMAHPMGPLHLADFIGLDVCMYIMKVLETGLGNPKYAPCPLLVKMVDAGKLGVKSGEGFYDYSQGVKQKRVSALFSK